MGRPITKDIPKREYNNSETPAFSGKYSCGLTKREYFAGCAMQGMLSNPNRELVYDSIDDRIKECIAYSDELLKQLATSPCNFLIVTRSKVSLCL